MRTAVLLLIAAGVFHCALSHPPSVARSSDDDPSAESVVGRPHESVDEDVEDATDENRDVEEDTAEDEDNEGTEDEGDAENADNQVIEGAGLKTPVSEKLVATTSSSSSKVLQTGNKKRKTKKSGPSKKMASKLLPLLIIPLMIQAQLIPMMLFKLKLMALKALMLGKAALVIILLNVLRNAFIGADSMEDQYEQQSLASSHYGYTGVPEYGAWVNKRVSHGHPNGPYRGHRFAVPSGTHQSPTDHPGRSKTVLLEEDTPLEQDHT